MHKRKITLLTWLLALSTMLNCTYGQQRISSTLDKTYEGVIRIKFSEETVDNFTSLQLKSASTSTPDVFQTGVSDIDLVNNDPDVFTFKRVFAYSPKNEAKHRKYGLHQWYEVEFDTSIDVETMMDNYEGLDGVEIIKPVFHKVNLGADNKVVVLSADEIKRLQAVNFKSTDIDDERYPFDDPLLVDQWHYENFGDVAGDADADIDLFGAWKIECGNDSVVVAIIDGGIDYDHVDLADAMWVNDLEMNGKTGVDDDENGFVDDIYGYNFYSDQGSIVPVAHGTHVAGTVGAVNNNGVGVSGVAGGDGTTPGVKLMSCQIFTDEGSSSGTAEAYIYAADNGAVIAQSSWSYSSAGYAEAEVTDAIEYFYNEAGDFDGSKVKGGVLLFSAGNSTLDDVFYPAAYENVLGVTSTGPYNTPSYFSNYNVVYDITAPGGGLLDDGSDAGGILSTYLDDEYGYMSGTSMSTPHVSGVAALIISHSTDEELTNEDVYTKLTEYISPFAADDLTDEYVGKMGTGHLNALNCLNENDGINPEPVIDFRIVELTHEKIAMEWQIPVDSDDIQPTSYTVFLGEEAFTADDYSSAQQLTLMYDGEVGDTVAANLSGLDSDTEFWVAIKAVDYWGNTSVMSEVIATRTLTSPLFYLDTYSYQVKLDVTNDLVFDTIVTICNRGEGELSWATAVLNNTFTFPEYIDSTEWFPEEDEVDTDAINGIETKSSLLEDNEMYNSPIIPGTLVETDPLDQTIYTSVLYSDALDVDPEAVYGDYDLNHHVVQATRFVVPVGYGFNMTHAEAWVFYENNTEALKLEVRKGKDLFESELVSQRYRYVDTTGVSLVRIPLEEPVYFSEGEYFWILIAHPKDETMPVVTNYLSVDLETSYLSVNSGYDWTDFYYLTQTSPQQMKVRAYSVGDDPSYLYLDPYSGTVSGNDSVQVHLYANAEGLRNGQHNAYINIYTNDYWAAQNSVEVNLLVSGQKGELEYEQDLDVNNLLYNVDNEVVFPIRNSGKGNLEIQGFDFDSTVWSVDFDSAYTLLPTQTGDVVFTYTPNELGYKFHEITIKTDTEDYPLFVDATTVSPAEVEYAQDTIRLSLQRGESTTTTFSLKNVSDNILLDFDVYSTTTVDGEWAYSPIYSYTYEGIVNDSTRWDKVNEVGNLMSYYIETAVPLSFKFPFYQHVNDYVSFDYNAWVYFSSGGYAFDDLPSANVAKGSIMGLANAFSGGGLLDPKFTYYKGYGNRFVIQADSIKESSSLSKGSFQVALFQDGAVEFRYRKIDSTHFNAALIGMQDYLADSVVFIKSSSDSLFQLHDHDYIRITPNESASFLGKLSTDNGRLRPDESVDITVDITPDSSQLVTGTFFNKIRVDLNTEERSIYIPILLTVEGVFDSIAVDTNKVEYGDVYTNTLYTDTLWMTNHSDDSTEVVGFESNVDGVSIRGGLPTLAPHESRRLLVDFIPTQKGEVISTLTLTTSSTTADGPVVTSKEIDITANVTISPTFRLDAADTYHFDLDKESMDTTVTLYNTSTTTPLKYQIFGGSFVSVQEVESEISTKSDTYVSLGDDELESRLTKFGQIDSSYSYEVSNGSNAVQYYLDELIANEEAERLTILTNSYLSVKLKFPFSFYGETYDSLWVCENGYVTFIEPEVDVDPLASQISVEDDGVRGIIAPFWSNWTDPILETAGMFMYNADDKLVLQWRNVYSLDPSAPGLVSFELVLFNDGRIKFIYKKINDFMGIFDYGIEGPDETNNIDLGRDGWDINSFGVYKDSSAITLAPAMFGEIPANGSVDFKISASPDYMIGGDYEQQIVVKTNAVNPTPTASILVSASITSEAEQAISDTIDFGTHYYEEGKVLTSSFWINNRGGESLTITHVEDSGLLEFKLLNELGYQIEQGARYGILIEEQELWPGELISYNVSCIPDSILGTTYGKVTVTSSDDDDFEFITKITLTQAPDVTSEMRDTTISLLQLEETDFFFEINNTGGDTLEYSTFGLFSGEGGVYDDPIAVPGAIFDSLSYVGNEPQSTYGNLDGYAFIMMNAHIPEEDFELTHVKIHTTLEADSDFVVRLQVLEYQFDTLYDVISADSLGTPVFTQEYRFEKDLATKWRYMALADPLTLEEGKTYIVQIFFPTRIMEPEVLSTYSTYDEEILKKNYYCSGSSVYNALSFDYMNMSWVPMIKLLSGGTTEGFLDVSPRVGKVAPNESQRIDVHVDASASPSGVSMGSVVTRATNVFDQLSYTVELNVNAKPEFTYRPTADTLVIQEKVPYVGSYLIEDPEQDFINCKVIDDGGLDVVFESKTDAYAGLYQISFNTGWEDQGVYDIIIEAADVHGNVNYDTLIVEVYNINRTPVLTFDDAITINIAHDEVFQMNMNEMFSDPDNDELSFQIGNGNEELYDMALMQDELVIVPIEPGLGIIILVADDGYDNGYSGYYYYVYVIDDATVAPTQDGISPTLPKEIAIEDLFTAPNPTTGNSGVYFNLEEQMHVSIELYDVQGRFIKQVCNGIMDTGNRYVETSLHDLSSGVYFYKVALGDGELQTIRLVKE